MLQAEVGYHTAMGPMLRPSGPPVLKFLLWGDIYSQPNLTIECLMVRFFSPNKSAYKFAFYPCLFSNPTDQPVSILGLPKPRNKQYVYIQIVLQRTEPITFNSFSSASVRPCFIAALWDWNELKCQWNWWGNGINFFASSKRSGPTLSYELQSFSRPITLVSKAARGIFYGILLWRQGVLCLPI